VGARDWTDQLRATADTVVPGHGPTPAATAEETERILRWLELPGIRMVHVDGIWSCPVGGAESQRELLDSIESGRESLTPFDQPRLSTTLSRPTR
jgi:DNA polymerase-3 subunit epsilon